MGSDNYGWNIGLAPPLTTHASTRRKAIIMGWSAPFSTASQARMKCFHFAEKERTKDRITRVGIDLGKRVFHVTAVDACDRVVERKRLGRVRLRSYLAELPCEVALDGRFWRVERWR